jgi:Flp pilus assembly protein TadG
MISSRLNRGWKQRQSGVAAVEFALIAIVFFTLLLGIIEFGRFLYVWNTVQQVTRAAAREAVVTDFQTSNIASIQKNAVFHAGSGGDPALPGGNEIASTKIRIQYLSAPDIGVTAKPADPAANIVECLNNTNNCIRFVKVEICEEDDLPSCTDPVLYQPMIGLFAFLNIAIPASSVTMPAESMGYAP